VQSDDDGVLCCARLPTNCDSWGLVSICGVVFQPSLEPEHAPSSPEHIVGCGLSPLWAKGREMPMLSSQRRGDGAWDAQSKDPNPRMCQE
jgi:hypothetical protein